MAAYSPDGSSIFGAGAANNRNQEPNPFYGISSKYIPLSIDAMLWWSEYLLIHNDFYKAALSRIVNYFINTLVIECDSEDLKKQYVEKFEAAKWKELLQVSGLNLLAYYNECLTVTQGIERFLQCKKCGNAVNIEKTNDYTFEKGKYSWKCVSCGCKETDVIDEPSKNINKIFIKHWPLRQLVTRHDLMSGQTEYHWQIPQDYIRCVSKKNNKFYSKFTPKYVMDCMFAKGGPKCLKLNQSNLIHLKLPHPTFIETNGKAIPGCMFMFDSFFDYATVKRFNEVIMQRDINPFCLFSMVSDNSPTASPVFNQNGGVWKAAIQEMIEDHRRDPGSFQFFPFPVNYQQLGGEANKLAPTDLMNGYKANILGALNIPQELFNMNLALQVIGPALRLFENSWSIVPDSLNQVLQHLADTFSKMYGMEAVKVKMLATTISDDMERKALINNLVQGNAIAKSTLLETVNLSYEDQIRKKMQEDKMVQDLQTEEAEKAKLEQAGEASVFNQQQQTGPDGQPNQYDTSGQTPGDVLGQAQQIAQQLFPLDGAQRRSELQKIKSTNQTLYAAVKEDIDQMTQQGKSQGLQASKQQAQQS
jgi:hypothetical protein